MEQPLEELYEYKELLVHGLYRDPKNPEINYRILGFGKNKEGEEIVFTTPHNGFKKTRKLSDCLKDERYFVKSCR